MPDKNYTHIQVLLDRSGSMEMCRTDMEGGFNAFLAEQQEQPGKATIGLGQFDNSYESVYEMVPLLDAPNLVLSPRGGTALLDAMATSIDRLGVRLKEIPAAKRPGTVLFVIITDGAENASRIHNTDSVFKRVAVQQEQFGWQFIYLGANQNAITVAQKFGIPMASSMTYDTGLVGVNNVYGALSSNISSTRSARAAGVATASVGFSDEDRTKATEK